MPPSPDARPAGDTLTPAGALCAAAIGLGLFLRVHAFAFPGHFLFDEHHFVGNARNYLARSVDLNDHPPLGKLLIALSMRVFGDNPVGWRAPALACGLASIALGAAAATRLFGTRQAGLFAATLLSADGFLIAYSRAGLLDGYLTALGLAALLLATFEHTLVLAAFAGVLSGAALAIKFSGIATLVPFAVALALGRLPRERSLLLFGVCVATALVTYSAAYAAGLAIARQPASLAHVFSETKRLYLHHAVLTDMKNPATSGWSSWWLPVRPILLGREAHIGSLRVLTSLGNLPVWWSSIALACSSCVWILVRGLRSSLAPAATQAAAGSGAGVPGDDFEASAFVSAHGRALVLTLCAAGAFLAPWVLTHRDSYIYHFLPSYAFLLLVLGGFLAWAERQRSFAVLVFLALVLVVAAFYAPVWSLFELGSERALRLRLFLASWR